MKRLHENIINEELSGLTIMSYFISNMKKEENK
jgi:hypothetical protein